jgi:F420-non-reducing hydrogenase small subunit
MSKAKIAVSWNSSCGGCDESIVDIGEALLDVAARVEFVLWPCAMDFKYSDVEKLADGEIDAALINGGIQNEHQESIALLLRKKSKIVVAYGSCAWMGGIPSLANLTSMDEIFRTSYIDCLTVDNEAGTLPKTETVVDGCRLTLPRNFESLSKLDDVIDVDYYLPGCPPPVDLIVGALLKILDGDLPPKGSVLAPDKALCWSCPRNETKPENIEMTQIRRIHEIIADPAVCFLAQDVICMGPATRDGCGLPCISGNMPCTGCMGPMSDGDQGARMIGAMGGILKADTEKSLQKLLDGIVDPAGTFYRYTTAGSLLGRKRREEN